MRRDERVVEAHKDGWDKRDVLAKKREEELINQSVKDLQVTVSERTRLINNHYKEVETLNNEHAKEVHALREYYEAEFRDIREKQEKEIIEMKRRHRESMIEEKLVYEEDVRNLKKQLEEKKKELDKTKKILEIRIFKADDILERLKKLALNLHIRQRESIEVLKEFNIQASKLGRHGEALEDITKFTEKIEKEFKQLKNE
jgi:hypothetical protein